MHAHMHAHLCVHIYMFTHVHVHTQTRTHTHTHKCTHTHTHTQMYMYTHTHTHTHTHAHYCSPLIGSLHSSTGGSTPAWSQPPSPGCSSQHGAGAGSSSCLQWLAWHHGCSHQCKQKRISHTHTYIYIYIYCYIKFFTLKCSKKEKKKQTIVKALYLHLGDL